MPDNNTESFSNFGRRIVYGVDCRLLRSEVRRDCLNLHFLPVYDFAALF